ncbi:MAG: 2-phospho-L-lactate transferase [Methanosphaera sp. rholeuAM130]|nr:MAG: 2-phospho-L-lactate transferase [Methanosphaera sp. rholeuAM130]
MICVLSGGTGTPKLLQGLKEVVEPEELTVIVNTLENDYFSGVYVSADIDTVMYTLADLINEDTWYGRRDDTFYTHQTLKELGFEEELRIGDKDRALKIQKTLLLKEYSLEEAVRIQCKNMGITSNVIPMSNQQSTVKIYTDEGVMSFHEFLIKHQSKPEVKDIQYNTVEASTHVIESIENADEVIIGPSNPITSINPIISMKGVEKALKKIHVTSISPLVGENAVSGPAAKFMKAKNMEINCRGVSKMYKDFLDHYIINTNDEKYKDSIEEFIPKVSIENIILKNMNDKINLSRKIIERV